MIFILYKSGVKFQRGYILHGYVFLMSRYNAKAKFVVERYFYTQFNQTGALKIEIGCPNVIITVGFLIISNNHLPHISESRLKLISYKSDARTYDIWPILKIQFQLKYANSGTNVTAKRKKKKTSLYKL